MKNTPSNNLTTNPRKEGVPLLDRAEPGLRIQTVHVGGMAESLGLKPGDEILSIGGEPIRDPIDFRFHFSEDEVTLDVNREAERLIFEIEKDPEDDLGVDFEDMGILKCDNKCVFCFLHQMPKGLRKTLYYQDDDFRLSFLHGAYVTLTNLDPGEFERIIEQRLTPMYVSVHATDPTVRGQLLGRPDPVDVLGPIDRLIEAGIQCHTQIVLCPGLNDGYELKRSVFDLADRHPGVASVGVVPLGLTRFRKNLPDLAPVTPDVARATLDEIHHHQATLLPRLGSHFVYAADEFYLLTHRGMPPRSAYDGFPLVENGVGMVRRFLDDFDASFEDLRSSSSSLRVCLVTGLLGGHFIPGVVSRLNELPHISARSVIVENQFLGPRITVSGLLAGKDIALALEKAPPGPDEVVVLPPNCVNHDGLFLDDFNPRDLEDRIGSRVVVGTYNLAVCIREIADGSFIEPWPSSDEGHPYIASWQFEEGESEGV